jgi:hypothetical protein
MRVQGSTTMDGGVAVGAGAAVTGGVDVGAATVEVGGAMVFEGVAVGEELPPPQATSAAAAAMMDAMAMSRCGRMVRRSLPEMRCCSSHYSKRSGGLRRCLAAGILLNRV